MSTEHVIKKTAFGGFNREDVLNYIEKLQKEIISLKSELSDSSEMRERISCTEKLTDVKDEELKSVKTEIEKLREENKALSQIKDEQQSEISEKEAQIVAYKEKISVYEAKVASIEEKMNQIETSYTEYARSEEEINSMLNDASECAEKIIGDAQSKASNIIRKAYDEMSSLIVDLSSESDRINTALTNFDFSAQSVKNGIDCLKNKLNKLNGEILNG